MVLVLYCYCSVFHPVLSYVSEYCDWIRALPRFEHLTCTTLLSYKNSIVIPVGFLFWSGGPNSLYPAGIIFMLVLQETCLLFSVPPPPPNLSLLMEKLLLHGDFNIKYLSVYLFVCLCCMKIRGMLTIIRDANTNKHDFIFYADRLIRLVCSNLSWLADFIF